MFFDRTTFLGIDPTAGRKPFVYARTLDAIAVQLEHVQECSPEQTIETLAMTYLSYASQNFNRWRKIFEYRLLEEDEIPYWYQEKVDNVFTQVEARFAELAPELSEYHRKRAARALWCGVHGICVLYLTDKQNKAEFKEIGEMIVLLVRNFIRGWSASSYN